MMSSRAALLRRLIEEARQETARLRGAPPAPPPPAPAPAAAPDDLNVIAERILADFAPDSRGKTLDFELGLRGAHYFEANKDALHRFQNRVMEARREAELEAARREAIASIQRRHERLDAEEAKAKADRTAAEKADLEASREHRRRLPAFREG